MPFFLSLTHVLTSNLALIALACLKRNYSYTISFATLHCGLSLIERYMYDNQVQLRVESEVSHPACIA